jgi:hypothetical protein
MNPSPDSPAPTIAGHGLSVRERAGGVLTLRIDLRGQPLLALAQELARLDGVRVTRGPESAARERCYLVHCPGFKLVLSSPAGEPVDFALALVSRAPQAALAVMSDLGSSLDRLMSEPPRAPDTAPAPRKGARQEGDAPAGVSRRASALRRSGLPPGKPLVRKTGLKRKTPLARGRFRRS